VGVNGPEETERVREFALPWRCRCAGVEEVGRRVGEERAYPLVLGKLNPVRNGPEEDGWGGYEGSEGEAAGPDTARSF
jgi:hypothetical protein